MVDISILVIGEIEESENNNIKITSTNEEELMEKIKNIQSKYITFVSDKDSITNNYLEKVKDISTKEFDYCYINYDYQIKEKKNKKVVKNREELLKLKPYYKEYMFTYIWKKEKLEKLLDIQDEYLFNANVDIELKVGEVIEDVIYYHNPYQEKRLNNFIYSDVKKIESYKNIIYVEKGCNGLFNGYITWIKQLENCYKDRYEVAILYDEIIEETKKAFEEHFLCIENKKDTIYICNRLLVTYTSYFYPKNIVNLEKSYLFIHGNMSDYKNAMKFHDDIYTNYVAVSKTASKKAVGYFPTKKIEYVLNPYKKEKVEDRLKIVSTLRYSTEKCPERIEKMASLMTKMEIPYTWEVFTDTRENTNQDGLIFRKRVKNPLPYVKDSDYFVLLSNTESFSYSVLEALSVNTKVVVTPLEVYKELGVKENENAIIIPFEYFEDGKEDKLKEVILRMVEEKNKKIKYKLDDKFTTGYDKIFV